MTNIDPTLSDAGIKEFEKVIERFKKRMSQEIEDTLGVVYVDLAQHIETDAWMNYRNELRAELAYECPKSVLDPKDHWGRTIRDRIFNEHKDELLKDAIISDLQKRIEAQNETIKFLNEYRYA